MKIVSARCRDRDVKDEILLTRPQRPGHIEVRRGVLAMPERSAFGDWEPDSQDHQTDCRERFRTERAPSPAAPKPSRESVPPLSNNGIPQ